MDVFVGSLLLTLQSSLSFRYPFGVTGYEYIEKPKTQRVTNSTR